MQFQHPEWLHMLWLVLAGLVFFIWVERGKQALLQKFGYLPTLESLTQSHSRTKDRGKKGFLLLSLFLLVIALAQPQWGETKKEVQRKGVEIIFLIDTSLSMLAEDVTPSRIEKAKLGMKSFLRELKGDKIGLVTFAGSGFVQSPLTLDYDAFLLFANAVQVGYIPDAGTSLREAIRTAVKGFAKSKQTNHVAILLSDGEDLEGDVESAIKTARDAKIRIYTIGLGTKEGAPIPLRSEQGKVSGYKKDRAGEVVITKLNEDLLTQIANETGGLYFASTPGGQEVEWIYRHIQNLEKKEFKQRLVVERENHFQLFLGFGLLFLFIEMFLSDAKRSKRSIHKQMIGTFLLCFPIWFLCSGFIETTSGLNQKGNKAFEGKRYESALEAYRKAQIKKPDNPTVRYNLGTTLYQLDQFQEAETQLEQALTNAKTKELKATAWYNYGNTQYRLGQFDKATEAYRKALDLNPNDKDAKYNLELLQKKKSVFDIKQNKRDQEKKENPPPAQQQQQQGGGGGKQDQKEQPSQGQQGNQQQQNQQDQESQQKDQKQGEAGQDKQNESQEEDKSESEGQESREGEKKREQPMTPTESQAGQEGPKPEEEQGGQPKPLLQGQMSQESALRILDALKESEQELQSLRRPHSQTDYEPSKDW